MKKKIFSALLMGVFVLSSMSMFVSCKDYDDDIDGLDTKQQELLSRLEALEGQVSDNLASLQSQLTTAVDNADKALAGVQGLEGTVAEIRSAAEAAGQAAATAQTTADGAQADADAAQEAAEAAQATADEALATAKAALEAAGADGDGQTALEQVKALAERVGALETLAEGIPELIEEVQKATKEELAELKAQVDKYEAYFDNLFAMVTGVELYGTFNGTGSIIGSPVSLEMLHGNVVDNSVFGDNEAYTTATPQQTFTKDADIKAKQGIIVRVNPVNAAIDGDNCAIKVINSKGEDMSDYIEVADVEPYEELITTRGGKISSGLYKVNFQFVDGVDMKAFDKAIVSEGKDVLFAVAINNTDTVDASRYVASTFDLALAEESYEPTTELDYSVTGTNGKKNVGDLRNRWSGSYAVDDNGAAVSNNAVEHIWAATSTAHPTPASEATKDNMANAGNADARSTKDFLPVSVGAPFTVELGSKSEKIAYYYVVLDKDFAGESAPSEWNAWAGYAYTGLQTVVPADEKLEITINSESANGEKIGFRVFAVNLDGTLVDPDGRAFYVSVGDEASESGVNAEIKVWKNGAANSSVVVPLPSTFKPQSTTNDVSGTIARSEFDEDGAKSVTGATISYQLCKDANGASVSDWKDAKYIKLSFNDPSYFLNDASFSFTIEAKSTETSTERVINTLNVTVKKVMPTAEDKELTFKAGQLKNNVYTCYLDAPGNLWTSPAANGGKDLSNIVTGMDDEHFTWTFADAEWDAAENADVDYEVTSESGGALDIEIATKYIDSKTQHSTTIEYAFQGINCVLKAGRPDNSDKAYPVVLKELSTIFACPLDPGVLTYSWKQKNIGTAAKPDMVDVNEIVYGTETPNNLASDEQLTKYIGAESGVDNAFFTHNGAWKDGLYVTVKATLTSNETGKVDYYDVTYSNGDFSFNKLSDSTNPIVDVPSTLTIKAVDAFNHETTIAELPFTVLRNK